MDFQIIPISEQYLEEFRTAVGSVARERKYLAFLDAPPLAMTRDFVKGNLKEGWPHFIAIQKNTVVGWCDISSLHRPIFAHSGVLGIGVIKEYRGKGVGSALMKVALLAAQKKGLTRIELTVREHNVSAITLYEKLGFVKEGVMRNAVFVDNQYENLILMALLFE